MWNIDALASLVRQPHEINGSFTHELDTLFFMTSAHKTQFHSKNKRGEEKVKDNELLKKIDDFSF